MSKFAEKHISMPEIAVVITVWQCWQTADDTPGRGYTFDCEDSALRTFFIVKTNTGFTTTKIAARTYCCHHNCRCCGSAFSRISSTRPGGTGWNDRQTRDIFYCKWQKYCFLLAENKQLLRVRRPLFGQKALILMTVCWRVDVLRVTCDGCSFLFQFFWKYLAKRDVVVKGEPSSGCWRTHRFKSLKCPPRPPLTRGCTARESVHCSTWHVEKRNAEIW